MENNRRIRRRHKAAISPVEYSLIQKNAQRQFPFDEREQDFQVMKNLLSLRRKKLLEQNKGLSPFSKEP